MLVHRNEELNALVRRFGGTYVRLRGGAVPLDGLSVLVHDELAEVPLDEAETRRDALS